MSTTVGGTGRRSWPQSSTAGLTSWMRSSGWWDLLRELLEEVAGTGQLRQDVAPDELAVYCLHALAAVSALPSEAAVRRLVAVTLAGLRPPR